MEELEVMINFKRDLLKKIAFQIYDFDQDQHICNLDLYRILKDFKDDDECITNAFAPDLALIGKTIQDKKIRLGFKDSDLKFKLKDIDSRLRAMGGELDVTALQDFNPNAVFEEGSDKLSDDDSAFGDEFYATGGGKGKKPVVSKAKSVKSRKSRSSRRSGQSLAVSMDGETEIIIKKEHPHDRIFSKTVN